MSELESKTGQVLQSMENMTVSGSPTNGPSPMDSCSLLPSDKLEPADLMAHLADLITHPEDPSDPATGEYLFPPLDDVSQVALISHSMAAYLHHLRRGHLIRLTSKIYSDTNRWLSNIFRFVDGTATYHHDTTDTVVRALRLAVMTKSQQAMAEGKRPSKDYTIYVCEESAMLSLQFAVKQLGLSLDCIQMVPQNTTLNSSGGTIGTMDVSTLQKMILADLAKNKNPVMVIASAGTPIMGSVDNITRIYEVCKAHNIWMHFRGHCIAALATSMGTGDVSIEFSTIFCFQLEKMATCQRLLELIKVVESFPLSVLFRLLSHQLIDK